MKRFSGWLVASLLLLAPLVPVRRAAAEETFRLGGAVERPAEWSVNRLSREFAASVETVHYTMRGEEHSARCVPLRLVAKPAPAQFETEAKNHELSFAVFVRGRDGYTACFSLGELLPEVGRRQVWLAFEVDGKPLAGKEGPIRLLTPDDAHPSRSIYGIASITLVDGRHLEK